MDRKTELFNALIKNCQAGRKAEQDADIVEELRLAKESVGMLEEVILHMKPGFRRDEGQARHSIRGRAEVRTAHRSVARFESR